VIRREPDASDTIARGEVVPTAAALRGWLSTARHRPADRPFWRHDGLAFDLGVQLQQGWNRGDRPRDGVITIDLVEFPDAYRESLRVRLGEPYRTMLGHFRMRWAILPEWLVETGLA